MNTPASKMDRRRFAALCAGGAGILAATGFAGWKATEGFRSKALVTRDQYAQLLNATFNATIPAVGSSEPEKLAPEPRGVTRVPLKLVSVSESVVRPAGERRFETFSINFEGPASNAFGQQSITVQHPDVGEQEVFLVPIGRPKGETVHYEAVFTRFK